VHLNAGGHCGHMDRIGQIRFDVPFVVPMYILKYAKVDLINGNRPV